jgi:UMF1 family MFS transporter
LFEMKKGDKRIINGWAMYDWANSVYPLVITTAIFPIFYEQVTSTPIGESGEVSDIITFFGFEMVNTVLYSYVISLGFLIVAFISPILSGIADYSGNKKRFLQIFCYMGAAGCASLFWFDIAHLERSMISVLVAAVGFWGSLVFYNAYLPEIAEPKDHDKVSAKGFSMGYLGSSILLIICLVMIQGFGVPAKWAFVLTAAWWIGFAQVTYRALPNNVYNRKVKGNVVAKGFKELRGVWKQFRKTKRLFRYIISFFIFSMGVQTVMVMASLFGAKEVEGMETTGLIISVLLIQFIAIPGAYLFSKLSSILGNVKALMIALVIWIFICLGSWFIMTPTHFYIAASFVGLVMGGVQSLSRSTYSKFLPETKDHASYFSFFDVLEKVGIVIGTFSFGYIEAMTGSMRNSIVALFIFFVIGLVLLMFVPKEEVELAE